MAHRSALQLAIKDLVEGYATSHKVIDLNRAASALSHRYPDCGLTIEEILKELEKSAFENGSVLFSDQRNQERR